jgi:hypothetical protein
VTICGFFRPVRVTQRQVFGNHVRPRHPGTPAAFVRLTRPHHRKVAIDGKGAMQFFGDLGIDRRFYAVPVKEHQHQDHHGD